MKETPASLAEQILELVLDELSVPQTPRNQAAIVSAILTVINPICNQVARLEAELNDMATERLALLETKERLSTLTRLATAVVSTANTFVRQSSLDHAEAIDTLALALEKTETK